MWIYVHCADYIKGLFIVDFSDQTSHSRPLEELVYMLFVDFLDEC